jgi:hypothetical protein
MLCDLLANERFISVSDIERADQAAHALKPKWWDFDDAHNIGQLLPSQQEEFLSRIKANRHEYDLYGAALKAGQRLRDEVNGKETILFTSDSMDLALMDDFRIKLKETQKFSLSPAFAETTMEKLATPETVVKAKSFFALTHDPMWIEWRYGGENLSSLSQGALMLSEPNSDYVFAFTVIGCPRTNRFAIKKVRFLPSTLRLNGEKLEVDWELESGENTKDSLHFLMDFEIKLLCDFVIRINSPRIIEFRPCEDLSRLNKKRTRSGNSPLFSYQVVDLSKPVKDSMKLSETEGGGVRFHWRRGHFKVCRTGIFWWNPHTAGRKVYGEIRKEYVA